MKRILAILLIALLALSLGGCSARKEVDASKLVIWHDKEDAVVEALSAYLAEACPGIEVTFEKKTSLTDSLKLVGNDPSAAPDMFIFAHDKVGVFAEMDILAPIEPLLAEDALANHLPMTLEAATYGGTLYQLPLYFETLLFLYNERYMLEGSVPATTEELYQYMQANTGRGRYGFVEQHSTAYYAAAWIHGFGGEIISADGEPFPNEEAVQAALAYHQKFVELMPGETEYATVNTLFLEGKADSTIGGPWMVPSAREAGIVSGHRPHAGGGRDRPCAGALFRRAGRACTQIRRREQGGQRARRACGPCGAGDRRDAGAGERLRAGERPLLR